MKIYRICKKKYAADISGKGSELFGGRWNPIGVPALYTSENRALSALELLVHTPKEIMPPTYVLLTLEFPKKIALQVLTIDLAALNFTWDSLQENDKTQEIGRSYFQEKKVLGFRIPSTIIKDEYNIVLNPLHKDYKELQIVKQLDFVLDDRLMK